MQRKFRTLSILLALSMILSPISLVLSNIANAEEDNIGIVEEKLEEEAEPSEEKEEEQEEIEGLEEVSELEELQQTEEPTEEETNRNSIQSSEDTDFEFDAETGTITGYKEEQIPSNLVIPEKINGVEVKHIGNKAFSGKKTIKEISFPQTLETIGEEAIRHCELGEIHIPSNVKEIKKDAFSNSGLTKVTFEDGLEKLGVNSFSSNSISEVTIPNTVTVWPADGKEAVFSSNKKDIKNWIDLKFVKIYNNSGATPKNTFGIVNPASVTIKYKDSNGKDIISSKTVVGKELKSAKNIGTNWEPNLVIEEGSKEYLTNYDEPYDIGYHIVSILDEISQNYYQMNKEYIFEPEEIEGYTTPEPQTITLNKKENTISFIYEKEGQEPTGPEADLKRAADILKVTVQNTDIELTSPVTDDKWIKLVDYDKGGDTSIYISWESSNEDLIEIYEDMGFITLPEEGEEEVRLTATLSKAGYRLEKHFDYVLTKNKPEETEDEKYINDAIKSLEWFKLKLNSDVDKNVNTHMEGVLKNKGFEGINVIIKSSGKPEYIDLDGNINYIFDEKYLKSGLPYDRQVPLTFEFSKGEAKKEYFIRTMVGWDRDKVRAAIEKNIIEPMSKDLIGENEGFGKIKEDFEVPTHIEYTTLSWESSNNNILKIEPSSVPLSPSNVKVIRAGVDKKVDLTCKVKFNHDDIELEKKYTLTVLALGNENDIRKEMKKLLDENYTVEKLKDFTNKQPIDADAVKNDIQLIRPRDTGIKDYFNYEFKVTSDNNAVEIKNNPITYRAYVYRPLPEEETTVANLTVNMKHKEKDITVSKVIPIKIIPLSQKEINDEIHLMELAKKNYFEGIRGDNTSADNITSNLNSFREVNLVDGKLVWTRHIDDDRNTGIYPDEIEGAENQEQWRLFKSSNPEIIKHENLIVIPPTKTTNVTIESTLSSKIYGKYAERYPDREDFQKLYRQNVSATVTVIGKEGEGVNLDEEIEFLKQCYEAYMTEDSQGNTGSAGLSMLAPGAARLAGMNVADIQKHLYIDEKNESAYQLSQSIITLIGADLDPRQYKDKSGVRNLVKELAESQQLDGENKGEFIGKDSDKNSIEAQARSIIALDMAGANYDREKIVSKLMEIYDKKDSHTYKDIKTEGIVLVALSNHKDIDGVNNKITEILNYLKTKQNEDGGFDIKSGFEKGKNSPTATGRVIQGLIANGINPLEDSEWIKNGSTMLNAIVKSKTVKDNMKHSGYGKGEEDQYTYYEATYTAFGALMDLKNQKSMFELLKLDVDSDAQPARVEIVKPSKSELEVGQSLALTAKVYDEDGKVLSGKELVWTSSNENIATVVDGNVETKGIGEVTITLKVKDTDIQDTFKLTVVEEIKTLEVNTAIIVFNEDGDYEIKSNPQKISINKDEHNGGFTVFGSLQATTDEYEASGDWITSIYGISGPSTGGWMFAVNGKIPDTSAGNVELKEGDKIIWFCTYDWKRDKVPAWEDLIGEEPEEKLSIKIIFDKTSIKVGEELPIVAEVRKGDTILKDKEIMWLNSNPEIATIEEGKLIANKVGEVTITVALVDNKDIKDTIKINIIEKDLTIEDVIGALRGYYSSKDEFTFRQALGYNYTSNNLEKDLVEIRSKFKINEKPESASEHVGNIMGLIAAGKDPYNYNNKDYVKILVDAQNGEGKFIIGEYDDYATTLAFSILALDMADADYNGDKAIAALLKYQGEDGGFGGVDETGMVLTALSKYKDKPQVQTAISKGLNYLKGEQDENTGGFIVWGGENPYSASAVLQGLIAVGEDPMSEKWTKGGKTIVDSLMNFYKDGHFEKESEWGPEPEINSVTEQAFIALADVYRGKSMFNEIKLNTNEAVKITIDKPSISKITEGETIKLYVTGYDKDNHIVPVRDVVWTSSDEDIAEIDRNGKVTTKKPGKVTITAKLKDIEDNIELEIYEREFEIEYIGDTEVENGKQADARVKIKNMTEDIRPATLIVTLYDKKNNRLLNYSILKRDLLSKEEVELATGFLVPNTGDYSIRAFLWEDLEKQNIIMQEAKEIKVAN